MHRLRYPFAVLTAAFALAVGLAGPAHGQSNYIPVQGRLTDAIGVPLDGTYQLTFRLYDVVSGGTALCQSQGNTTVAGGLFSTYVNGTGCGIDGRTLYLGIEVGTDGEMAPRLYVDNAVYAWTLRPGAIVKGSSGVATVHIENAGASGRGLRAYATATSGLNYGVVGASTSPDGLGGYFYNVEDGVGLRAEAGGAGFKDALEAESESGDGISGVALASSGRGVYADNTGAGTALAARANSSGTLYPTLYLVQENAAGNYVVGASSYFGTRSFRIDRSGKGFFEGGTQTGGADFAERLDVGEAQGTLEPGDVLVISGSVDRAVERSAESFSTAVIGVYSTRPGVLAGAPDTGEPLVGVPVAITGIVPCKATTENGAIRRGDLLVTSSASGHAMRAGTAPPRGSVIGKAMQALDHGAGVIEILVNVD